MVVTGLPPVRTTLLCAVADCSDLRTYTLAPPHLSCPFLIRPEGHTGV